MDRSRFTQDYDTHIVACRRCGLICRNPHPRANSVMQAYASDQYDRDHLRQEFNTQLRWARTKIPVVRSWLAEKHRPRLVEVGSFVGGFLAAAREEGWSITGVDPGETVTDFCSEYKLPVYRGTIENAPLRPGELDGIMVWNTFDQLPDPYALLASAADSLKSRGLLVIRIPHGTCYRMSISLATRHRWMQRVLYPLLAWNNLLSFPYLHGYDVNSLDRLVAHHGFRREAVYPDTLMTSSTPTTRWWARLEEQLLKALCRSAWQIEGVVDGHRYRTACWLDVYYRRTAKRETQFTRGCTSRFSRRV
ncbi:conserved hypothetical protein [Candidatus Nitrospira nitrificans]|uniref:Methyltransferase type 11 n=2 Tax=Candidatus Nitrospira nitrificans TaxID=1742973 RepID=A0A0S4LSJ9_9BACT|nr:conserved hypothetical protein [Candidatus Nitrospira nitrificans]